MDLELETCNFCGAGVEVGLNLCGGISKKKGANVHFELQTCTFCASRVKIRLNRRGGIS